MRKQLYLDIKDRLKAVKNGEDEQLFQHIDLWNRQVEFIEQETPFACPAVFVEFMPMAWKTGGNRVQNCSLTVRLHVVTEWSAGTEDGSPTEQQALEFLDIPDRLILELQGFGTNYMSDWMRVQSITSHDHEQYVDNVEEYVCNLHDFSAVRTYVPVTPDLIVTPQ